MTGESEQADCGLRRIDHSLDPHDQHGNDRDKREGRQHARHQWHQHRDGQPSRPLLGLSPSAATKVRCKVLERNGDRDTIAVGTREHGRQLRGRSADLGCPTVERSVQSDAPVEILDDAPEPGIAVGGHVGDGHLDRSADPEAAADSNAEDLNDRRQVFEQLSRRRGSTPAIDPTTTTTTTPTTSAPVPTTTTTPAPAPTWSIPDRPDTTVVTKTLGVDQGRDPRPAPQSRQAPPKLLAATGSRAATSLVRLALGAVVIGALLVPRRRRSRSV